MRFHATQSVITFGDLTVMRIVIQALPFLKQLVGALLSLLGLALWIILMIKAGLKERYKLHRAGNLAEDYAPRKSFTLKDGDRPRLLSSN